MTPIIRTAARILIIDDEPANVTLLERILHREGYTRLESTSDSRQAAELYDTFSPDLVLLDLQMPYLDGFAVVAAFKTATAVDGYVPILVLTSDITTDARDRALQAGANDFLTKPFDRTEVLLRIANLLETRFLHQRLSYHNRALQDELREQAESRRRAVAEHQERRRRIQSVLDRSAVHMVFQPIAHLRSGEVVGAEALARFPSEPPRAPDLWFAEAASVGLGVELELAAIRSAVTELDRLPPGTYLSVNASPAALLSGAIHPVLAGQPGDRLVLELTEHAPVDDYAAIIQAMGPLRERGIRLAIDDTGAGFASLEHVLRLRPEIVKLDIALTRGIDTDPVRRALAAALLTFTAEIDATIVAEGVETATELDALRNLQVNYGQGFHLSRPGPLPLTRNLAHIAVDTRTADRPWHRRTSSG
ncbi:MAG TPA: EAL domain-containing protein [Mycobacteriales bacterium]|nr:EAL domain-containing protein [Mycobacteriales bacterium]